MNVARYLALVILMLALAVAVERIVESQAHKDAVTLRNAQVRSCERVNSLREETNRRIENHNIDIDVLRDFLSEAQEARRADNPGVARNYGELVERLEGIRFQRVLLTDCEVSFPRP